MDQVYDVLIVGGGSAATSAAMTLRNRGKSIAVVTNKPETSSLYKAEKITNYPGLPPMTGAEITALFRKQLEDTGATIIEGRTISVLPMEDSFGVAVGSDYYMARSIIITAGITREKLYPGEAEFLGKSSTPARRNSSAAGSATAPPVTECSIAARPSPWSAAVRKPGRTRTFWKESAAGCCALRRTESTRSPAA